MHENILILLPVKFNSKRLFQKNLKSLNGLPLFIYSLITAIDVKMSYEKQLEKGGNYSDVNEITRLINPNKIFNIDIWISTENLPLAIELLRIYRPEFLDVINILERPKVLAEDPYQIKHVCQHAIDEIKTKKYNTLVMIQPSNPFVETRDVFECLNKFYWAGNTRKIAIRSVYKISKTPFYMIENDPFLCSFSNQNIYLGNGSIVVCDTTTKKISFKPAYPYIMPKERSVDIDDEFDFKVAEMIMQSN